MMDEVARGLFVGSLDDSFDDAQLTENRISCVVNLADEVELAGRIGLEYYNFGMPDDCVRGDMTTVLPKCLETVRDLTSRGETVLVHCLEGKSRSVCVALAYMFVYGNRDWDGNYRTLSNKRGCIDPFPSYLAQTKAFCDTTRTEKQIRHHHSTSSSDQQHQSSKSHSPK